MSGFSLGRGTTPPTRDPKAVVVPVTEPRIRLRRAASMAGPAVVIVILVLGWLILGAAIPSAVPTPIETYQAVLHGIDRGWMQTGLTATMKATFTASAIAIIGGIAFSLLIALNRFWGDVWDPILVWLYSVPKIVLFPVVMLFFGISIEATTAFGVINGILPVAIITFGAIRSVPPIYLKVARTYGLSRWHVLRDIVAPLAAPSIVTAARYGFSTVFLAVIIGEMLASREGIGRQLFHAIALHDPARLFAISLILAAIAVAVNGAFFLVQRLVVKVDSQRGALIAPPTV